MKRTLLILSGTIATLVIAFLVYDILKGVISPCETIFQQTSVQLRTKLELIDTEQEAFIGKEKIQDLTEAAQVTALNLKTCCIVLKAGNVDSNQFLQCKDTAKKYEEKVEYVVAQIEKAEAAKIAGNTEVFNEKIQEIHLSVDEAKRVSEAFQDQVGVISKDRQPKSGKGEPVQAETQPRPTRAPASESALKLTAILAEGTEPLTRDLTYNVYEAKKDLEGNRKHVSYSYDAAPLFKLPVGRYYVTVEHGSAYASTEVEVTAAQVTQQILNLNAGYLRLSSILAQDTEPLTRDLTYNVYEAKKDPEGNRKHVSYSYDAAPLFRLPAGRYYVTVEYHGANASRDVEVAAGQVHEIKLEIKMP